MNNIVETASAELGYAETGDNDTKFGKWYGMNNQPWCAMFVSWVYHKVGLSASVAASTKKGFASCDAGLKWFAKTRLTSTVPSTSWSIASCAQHSGWL